MKLLTFDQSKCNNCGACTIVCSLVKKDAFVPGEARIRIETAGDEQPLRAVVCQHCEDPICVTACMRGIIHKDPDTGVVLRKTEDCFRCAACHVMCPEGAAVLDHELQAFVTCDLCGGRPVCAGVCPTGALRYEDVHEMSAAMRTQYARQALFSPGLLVKKGGVMKQRSFDMSPEEERIQWEKVSAAFAELSGRTVGPDTLADWSAALRERQKGEGE